MNSLTQIMHSDLAMSQNVLVNTLQADVIKPLGNIKKIFKSHWYQLVP